MRQIDSSLIRANAHLVERLAYPAAVTEEHYTTIAYPRLRELRFYTYSGFLANTTGARVGSGTSVGSRVDDSQGSPNSVGALRQVAKLPPSQWKAHFARQHPHVRKLTFCHRDPESRAFWEVVETDWKELEELDMGGIIERDALETFWRVCSGDTGTRRGRGKEGGEARGGGGGGGRGVRHLRFTGIKFPGGDSYLSTMSFERLETLAIVTYPWNHEQDRYRSWPLVLLEQVKKTSRGLRRLEWHISYIPFPVQMVRVALAEGCWPDLTALVIKDMECSEEDVVEVLGMLSLRRLTALDVHGCGSGYKFGRLLFDCLREMQCFDHLRELDVGRCTGVSSMMAQEVLMGCVHLVYVEVPFILVRDVVTASKPWNCLRLERLVVYIAKQDGDEAEWEERVFEQISRLGRMRFMYLERYPYDLDRIMNSTTLNLRLLSLPPSPSIAVNTATNNSNSQDSDGSVLKRGGNGGGIGWLSSLLQLREFTFDDVRQRLGMEEAMWMMKNWRDLVCVRGTFKGVSEGDDTERLKRLFAARGIEHYS